MINNNGLMINKEKVIDDNIGNRIEEPTNKPAKKRVSRAKNDPRSRN